MRKRYAPSGATTDVMMGRRAASALAASWLAPADAHEMLVVGEEAIRRIFAAQKAALAG